MLATIMSALRFTERVLVGVILVAMSVMYFANVLIRQFSPELATHFSWIEEATLFALAWLVFIGLGLALERRQHIAMTIFIDGLSPAIASKIHILINLVGLGFALFLTKTSFDLAVFIWNSGQVSPTLGTSMVGLYAPLPVGFALLSLRFVLELIGAQNRFQIRETFTDL